ncbi:50S ribosomal protein L6 [Thermotoga sp. KOL6]|uniref:50S ribosomal protein L6 n=1 Tax=Thermotoga sp. KOL6 TaxID=126741 RepID=UPI000C78935D|nr:50S ribosomal protein L6 [Thermotoga sp. KOL6]PLV60215.1 50S ribosomal protein L6 [Thermotoga sp. KOL6]
MSRLAKKPIDIPQGVSVEVQNNIVKVKGPKGELSQDFLPYVKVVVEDEKVWVKPNEEMVRRKSDWRKIRMFQGTYWSLIRNMIIGVTEGYKKELEIVGIGYRAQLQGNTVVMNLGYAHPVVYQIPSDVRIEVPAPNRIVVSGIDKQRVGQVAAEIRAFRPPNVYTGKGIRYVGEMVRQKEGKKA